MVFMIIMVVGTSIFLFYLHLTPLISPEKFPDEQEALDGVMLAHWWDNYKHPLIASNVTDDDKQRRACLPVPRNDGVKKFLFEQTVVLSDKDSPPKLSGPKRRTRAHNETLIGLTLRDSDPHEGYEPLDPVFSFVEPQPDFYREGDSPRIG